MVPEDFALFYKAVHGHDPFPWQARLARHVSDHGWPDVLALPTAAGKTASIDVAVFALALQAGRPQAERTAPLRIFFVIDRRLVVDQAASHAHKLRAALLAPGDSDVVRQVAQELLRFGGSPLQVAAMRGGVYQDDGWARAPHQPTVCISTVDQVGSRLLFRGYGVSEYARPVHAALTGNDALYLVDEAHLSVPFLRTLQSVARYRQPPRADSQVGGPFRVVDVSATSVGEGTRFGLGPEDFANDELNRRLSAPKPARLVKADRFEEEAVALAEQAVSGEAKVIGIVVNRVASARLIFNRLKGRPFEDKVLLTGRIRPWDRDAVLQRCLPGMKAGRERAAADRPLFVVATMTVEVGADLDFDYLITETAPLSALRQRFGRLDRLGRYRRAQGAILLRKAKEPDPIYGKALLATWEWLWDRAGERKSIDFGVSALDRLLSGPQPPPPAPVSPSVHLLPAHLDAWVQTSPEPRPSPDVAPFLHGADALEAADVQLVWRADLSVVREEDWLEVVAVAPPRSREALSLPVAAARAWLSWENVPEIADLEGVTGGMAAAGKGRPCLRWSGPDSPRSEVVAPPSIRPGDTLVVPSEYGGHDEFGWAPQSTTPVADVADLCVNDMANSAPDDGSRRLIRLRLHAGFDAWLAPAPFEGEPEGPCHPPLVGMIPALRRLLAEGEEYEDCLQELLGVLDRRLSHPLLCAVLERLARGARGARRVMAYPSGVLLTGRVAPGFHRATRPQPPPGEEQDGDWADGEAFSDSGGTRGPVPVELGEHAEGVARWTGTFSAALGLDEGLGATLKGAALLHDLGKADWRFQYVLYGDEPGERLRAKSGKDLAPGQYERVRARATLPRGFRHEFVSVAFLRAHGPVLLADLGGEAAALVQHLVGSHHGRGRPFVPFVAEGEEVVSLPWGGHHLSVGANHQLWRLGSGWADNFWQLTRRYGYWGLAFLEACLRLADAARSREEETCPAS